MLGELRRAFWRARTRHWFVYEPTPLQIRSGPQTHEFTVEVARTSAERNFGLSWRRKLPARGGMLFVYPDTPQVEMWMANTYLALDMVFIAPSRRIDCIVHNLAPLAPGHVSSGRPTLAVLELAGGTAARLSLKPGDVVACLAMDPARA
jgi:uncharacterized protein